MNVLNAKRCQNQPNFSRLFNPKALHRPRDFVLPRVLINDYLPNKLAFEIGAGRGLHAHCYAKNNPNCHIIAIERTKNKAMSLLNHQYPNLTAIHSDAIAWTVFALMPKVLDVVFILYPNPEPHNKNQRFVNMPYFEFLLSRLKDGGSIIITSNIADYIQESTARLTDVWHLPYQLNDVPADSRRTHFEIKYLARGEMCYQIEATKPDNYRTRFDGISCVEGC